MDEELSFECKLETNTQLWSCEMCNVAAECIIEQRNFFQSWGRGGSLNSFIFTFRFSSPYACMWHVIRITTKCIFRFTFSLSHPSGNIHLVAIGDFLILTLLLHTLYKSYEIHGLLFLLLPLHSLFHFGCFSITIVAKRKCIRLSMCQICHCISGHCYLFSHAI